MHTKEPSHVDSRIRFKCIFEPYITNLGGFVHETPRDDLRYELRANESRYNSDDRCFDTVDWYLFLGNVIEQIQKQRV